MEVFAKPGVGGIITKNIEGTDYILIQERCKEGGGEENGLIEIPAGKIREFENIFDCLKREIWEETGLKVIEIEGEKDAVIIESNGYKVINYMPFACAQNIKGSYPIMVQTFICKVEGQALEKTNETQNIRWVSLNELKVMLDNEENKFYPMHIGALKKYLNEGRDKMVDKVQDLSISEMLDMSYKLWEKHKDTWSPMEPEHGKTFILYMIEEIGEVIAIIKKKTEDGIMNEPMVREHFIEELGDVLMYYSDILNRFKVTPEEFSSTYMKKFQSNMNRDYEKQYKNK